MERSIQQSATSASHLMRPEASGTHGPRASAHGHLPKTTSDYARAVRKRVWVVLAVALVVIPPGTIYCLKQPDRYRAYARILIEPPHFDERVATILPHSGVGQSSRESVEKYVPNQIAELRNPGLAERVAADPDYNFSPAEMAKAISLLAKLQTRQHPNSNTFDVMLDGTDRSEVTALLNGLLQEFAQQAKQTSTMAITKSQQLASESLGNLKRELLAYDQKIEGILEGSNLFGVNGRSLPEEQYLALSSKLAAKESQYESMRQQVQVGKLSGRNGPSNSPYAIKIEALKEQRERLEGWLTQNRRAIRSYGSDPVAKNVARMYQETLEELEQLQKLTMRPESDWSSAILMQYGQEVKQLEQQVKEQLDQAQDAMPQYMNYLSVLREREQKQENLVTMQDRLSAFDLLAATSSDPVQVLLPAEEPTEPTGPRRKIQMALVVLAGLGLGIGLVCLMESLDHRIKVPEHLVAGVTLPLFGVVPRMRRLAALHRGGHFWTPGLPKSVEADAFRNLRASLLCATGKSGKPIVTLLVTSPKPAEGKSTTALNLAATCARCGERTLLIDADLRRPSLTPVFEPQHELGLVDVLKGDMPWQRALVRTEIATLDYLPTGDPTGVPFEILGTLELAQLMKAVAGHYHRVIIDGPAVLGMADCRMLGRVADAALLVVRSGTQSLLPVQRARDILDQSRIKIAGVVFNGLDEDLENWGGLITQMGGTVGQGQQVARGLEESRLEGEELPELEAVDRR